MTAISFCTSTPSLSEISCSSSDFLFTSFNPATRLLQYRDRFQHGRVLLVEFAKDILDERLPDGREDVNARVHRDGRF